MVFETNKIIYSSVKINSLNIMYRVCGSKKDPVLIFLHGWGGNSFFRSNKIIKKLSKRFYVVFPEMPGFMNSDVPDEIWKFTDYADFLNLFLEKIGLKGKYYFVSYSYFGGALIEYVQKFPENVMKIFLIDSVLTVPKPNINISMLTKRYLYWVKNKFVPFSLKKIIAKFMLGRKYRKKDLGKMIRDFDKMNQILINSKVNINFNKLKDVKLVMIWGNQDLETTPISIAKSVHKKLDNSELIIVDGSHAVLYKNSNLVLSKIFDRI